VRAGGKDATALFESMHPNASVREQVLPKYKIGEIDLDTVPQNQVRSCGVLDALVVASC
jgi:hypothetical protein